MRRILLALALVFAAFPAVAQDKELHPYFSLSSDRTFLPGDKPTIRLYTQDVDRLEFRVYHVNDPEKFFSQLENVHSFGERHVSGEKENIEEESWIEKFHDWKRSIWRAIRDFFRRQFSAASRTEIRLKQAEEQKTTKVGQATLFAQVPVLNANQLVARWRQDIPPKYFSESQEVPLDSLKSGVYLVEATDGHLRAYTVLIVSQMGLITKTAAGQVVAYTADRKTGAPLPEAKLAVYTHGEARYHGATDAQGMAETRIAKPGEGEGEDYENTWMLATKGDEVAIVSSYSFSLSSDPYRDWQGYIYTDRPVYRPTHTVHFKGILRQRVNEKWTIPSLKEAQVVIQDPDSKTVYQKTLPLNAMGTFHGDLDLPSNAALGYYSINVQNAQGVQMNGSFYVEEYKKPEYEVKVNPDKPRVIEGEPITATIEAKYYFGEPVAGAKVTYVVHTMSYWTPYIDRYTDDDDNPGAGAGDTGDEGDADGGDYEAGSYNGDQESEQTGTLDADGKLRVTIPTKPNERREDIRYHIEARVMDAANREITGANSVIATYGNYNISVQPDSYVYDVGQAAKVHVVAKDYDGKPVQAKVHLELLRWTNQQKDQVQQTTDVTTGADGYAVASFTVKEAGSYWVRAHAPTVKNRTLEDTAYLWVAGPGEHWWSGEERQIKLVSDKKVYTPGETAHVLVMSGIDHAYALVTLEGRDVQEKKVVELKSATATVDVPITDASQPNVYIGVAFFNDNSLYQATKNLRVPATDKQLTVDISPTKETFVPGEKASYVINVKDAAGKPVAGEFSIGVVDEAIYAIKPDTSGDMMQTFYGSVYDAVTTDSSLSFYFSGSAGERPMPLANRLTNYKSRSLAQLKPETLVQPKIRKNFPDTALWQSEIRTDDKGFAIANLVFPDSLTTWRATVRGVTADTKVGSAINRIIVRKNVMVRLATPRFFRDGDEVTLSVIVHNYLKTDKDAQVSLDVQGLDVLSGSTQTLHVPSRGEVKADWRVRAGKIRNAVLTAKALTNEESDAMQITLPVVPYGVKLADGASGAITQQQGHVDSTVSFPQGTDPSAHSLEVDMSPSIAGSIFGALDYLTSYPYGCTEQTMSGFLPDVVVARAMKDLKLEKTVNTPELEQKIRAGLDRLYDFQHEDGGWGWWKDDESQVFMTAYVVSGLQQAKEAGYDVKQEALDNGRKFLRDSLAKYPRMRPDLQAYVTFALINDQDHDPKILAATWDKKDRMTTQGLAFLALALHAAGDMRAVQVAGQIEKQATVTDTEAWWSSDFDSFMEFYIDDSSETTAYAVRALSLLKPDSPLLTKAAYWLVRHRSGGYYWYSTKQTAMVVYGLTEYLRVSHELEADFNATALVNAKQVAAKHFTRADVFDPASQSRVVLTPDQLQQSNAVSFSKSGSGRLYWATRAEYYTADKRMFQSNKLSLSITRDYFRLNPSTDKQGHIVYDLVPLSGDLHPGDVLAVRLTVGGSEWRYLMIEDPIPAGAEFLEKDDLYNINNRPDWWESYWSRREFHDDHAAIFQTYFNGSSSATHYFYLLKMVNPGKYRVSPASVQPMYQPGIISTTDAAVVEVK